MDELVEKNRESLAYEMKEMSQKATSLVKTQLDKEQMEQQEKLEQVEPVFKETTKPKKKFEPKMTEDEKEMNRRILKNMNKKLNFVRNPRFRNNNKCLLYTNTLFKEILSPENPFVVEPMIVTFREYQVNNVYQIDLKLLNRKHLLTSFKYIPPMTENFSVKRVIYPKKDTSLIAPGMSAKIEILFISTSLDSFQDEITIISENFAFKVPLRAIRDTPALSLENPMDCNKCLIGDQVSAVFRCKNNGGDAHFKFLTREHLEENDVVFNSSNMSANNLIANANYNKYLSSNQNDNEVLELGPFSIFPSEFYLYRGMMIEIFVNFSPKLEGFSDKDLVICCDSKVNLDFKVRGEGILIDLQLISLDGVEIEETLEKLENLFFDDTFPCTTSTREMRIKNKSSVGVKFHWNFYDYYSQNTFAIEEDNKFFQIEPEEGVFSPLQEMAFTLKFNPKNSKIYDQKLDLMIEDIPFQAIKQYTPSTNLHTIRQKNHFTKGEPFLLAANSPYPSYPIFSFNLKGKGKLPYLEVDNGYLDIGNVYIGQTINKTFCIHNPKTGLINFRLSKLKQLVKRKLFDNKQVNNFFKDVRLPDESLFKQKKSVTKYTPKKLESVDNLIKQLFNDAKKKSNDDDEDSYAKVNFIKLYSSSKFLSKKLNANSSTISIKKAKGKNTRTLGTFRHLTSLSLFSKVSESSSRNMIADNKFDALIEEETDMSIEKDQKMDFNIIFVPKSLGLFKATMLFSPDDGIPFSIDLRAQVKGPKLKVDTPCLDFGLFEISEIRTVKFKISNTSPISATYLIKQSKFKNLNLQNFKEENYKQDVEGIITEAKFRKEINTIKDYDSRGSVKRDFKMLDLYELKFSSVNGVIEPHKDKEITVREINI